MASRWLPKMMLALVLVGAGPVLVSAGDIPADRVPAMKATIASIVGKLGALRDFNADGRPSGGTATEAGETSSGPDAGQGSGPAVAEEVEILNTYNTGRVRSGPTARPVFTIDRPMRITHLQTYHWNGGRGTPQPGVIAIKGAGRWQASGQPGMNETPNAEWVAKPGVVLEPGRYTVFDGDPGTWSHNSGSGGVGFAIVRGVQVGGSEVAVATPDTAPVTRGTLTAEEPDGGDFSHDATVTAGVVAADSVGWRAFGKTPPGDVDSVLFFLPEGGAIEATLRPCVRQARLRIFDAAGRLIGVADTPQSGYYGLYTVLRASDLQPGVYVAEITHTGIVPCAEGEGWRLEVAGNLGEVGEADLARLSSATDRPARVRSGPFGGDEDKIGDFDADPTTTRAVFMPLPNGWLASGRFANGDVDTVLFATAETGDVKVTLRPCNDQAQMRVLDLSGRELARSGEVSAGYGYFAISRLADLPRGTYAVEVRKTGGTCEGGDSWSAQVAGPIILP